MHEIFGIAALAAALAIGIASAIGAWVQPRPVPEYGRSLVIWGVQLLVSMAAVFWVGFLGISTPHCSPNCEWDLLGYNFQAFMIATAVIQFVSMVLIVVMRHRRRAVIVPLVAIALTVILCVVSSAIAYKAMLFY